MAKHKAKRAYELLVYYDIENNISDMLLNKIHENNGEIIKQESWGFRKIKTPQKHNKLMVNRYYLAMSTPDIQNIFQFCRDYETIRRVYVLRHRNKDEFQYILENDSSMLNYDKTLIKS